MNKVKLLRHNVLVLNKHWIPIHITTVRDAIGLVFVGAAKVVSTDNVENLHGEMVALEYEQLDYDNWILASEYLDTSKYSVLSSSKNRHFKPFVIALNGYAGVPKYEIKFSRSSLYERDKGQCQYCGTNLTKTQATIDHIVPKSRGGKNTWDNTVLCCKGCNDKKADKTLEDSKMRLLNPPKKPTWISTKFGKTKTVKEREEWSKFINYV